MRETGRQQTGREREGCRERKTEWLINKESTKTESTHHRRKERRTAARMAEEAGGEGVRWRGGEAARG